MHNDHTHTLTGLVLTALTPLVALAQAPPDINAHLADVQIEPPNGETAFATAVSDLGDIDGDGFADVLASASAASKAWVFFGPMGTLDPGGLFVFSGAGGFGASIDGGGDFNGDGAPDIMIGEPHVDIGSPSVGRVRVFSGVDGSLLRAWVGGGPSANMGFRVTFFQNVDGLPGDEVLFLSKISNIMGMPETQLRSFAMDPDLLFTFEGLFVSNAGVVNPQDSIPDIAIGLPLDDTNGLDAGFLIYRKGSTGALIGPQSGPMSDPGEQLGGEVMFMNDLNGDGLGDVLTSGVAFDSMRGRVRVISGLVPDHPTLRLFDGEAVGDQFGKSIANVGDVNGDGTPDIAIGAPMNDFFATDAGRVYLYSGASGALLMTFSGVAAGDHFGSSVSGADDFNGDGVGDLIVSAPGSTAPLNGTGMVYVFFLPRQCPADLDGSGVVDGADLASLLTTWGACPAPTAGPCLADFNGDGVVDGEDMAFLLANWGPCPAPQGAAMAPQEEPGLGGESLFDPPSQPNNQAQAPSGELFFLSVISQYGFDDVDSYFIWLASLDQDELAAHIADLINAILEAMK